MTVDGNIITPTKVFNPQLPKLGIQMAQPSPADIRDARCFKYADMQFAYRECGSDYIRHILDHIPVFHQHKRVLIDIKVHDLKHGEYACVPGWHLDGSVNPRNLPKKPEILTLFVTGSFARTKFLYQPIELPIDDDWDFAQLSRNCAEMIPEDIYTWSIPSATFGTYDDSYFHRGTASRGKQLRLLIRTTETDVIEPQNRIYTPYTHS